MYITFLCTIMQNHMVEHIYMYVEVNAQVNYHIKDVLNDMMEGGNFSLDDDAHGFCVSWFASKLK